MPPFIKIAGRDKFIDGKGEMQKGTLGSGTFYNKQGDFVKYIALRCKCNEPDALHYEWLINVSELAIMNGVKIP